MKRISIILLLLAATASAQVYQMLDSMYTRYKVFTPHAQQYLNAGAAVISISVAGTYEWVTIGLHSLMTVNESSTGIVMVGDSCVVQRKISVIFDISLTLSGNNGDDYRLRLTKNGVAVPMGPMSGTTTGATNFLNISTNVYVEVDSGNVFKLEITNLTDADDPTVRDVSWVASTQYKRD